MATPLEIGQAVRIPLNASNFSQNGNKENGETLLPVYHIVQPREWMYRISVNYNKVPIENLQKWNSVGKDGAKPGTKLIVGFLKVKDAHVALATKPVAQPEQKPVAAKTDTPEKVNTNAPVVKQKTEAAVVKAEPPAADTESKNVPKEGNYFKSLYNDSGKSAAGIAGIFKSTSGWKDGKYYALANNVPVGTIIKITYPGTNKSVYAKVLGELPDMKESAGLALRISDAAAYELGTPESKISVNMNY